MDLSSSHGSSATTQQGNKNDLIDLMKHQQQQQREHDERRRIEAEQEEDDDEEQQQQQRNGINTDDIVPSYDFQPIRPLSAQNYDSAPNLGAASAAFSRPWNSDSNSNSAPPVIKVTSLSPFDFITVSFVTTWNIFLLCFCFLFCG